MTPSPARILVAAALCLPTSGAFIPPNERMPPRRARLIPAKGGMTRGRGRLCALLPRDDHGGGEPAEEDGGDDAIEAARRRLEAMMVGSTVGEQPSQQQEEATFTSPSHVPETSSSPWSSPWLHPIFDDLEEELTTPPPLTAIGRERMEAEIDLLASLEVSDDAISDLWSLWFSSRGPGAAAELMMAEELAGRAKKGGGPKTTWAEAEARLRAIVAEHGVHWAEPLNRLATLSYRRGRLSESRRLCELVLATKPWHFGALSGIVAVCAKMGDARSARMWADRRLPPIQPTGDNRRRTEWVRRAVREASRALRKAEEVQRKSFRGCDDEESDELTFGVGTDIDEFDDAWQ